MEYILRINDLDKTNVWQLEWTSLNIKEELNKSLVASVDIPYPAMRRLAMDLNTKVLDILASGVRFWELYWGGQLVFEGIITHLQIAGGSTGAVSVRLDLTCFLGALDSRRTDSYVFYGNDDSADIIWSEIDTSQSRPNGDLGITRGSHPTTVNRQRTSRHRKLLELAASMSNEKVANGYDMDIDTSRQFNIYYPTKGADRNEIVFSDFNILSWQTNLPLASKIANRIHVIGEGQGETLISTIVENLDTADNWLLWEAEYQQKTTTDVDELTDRGTRELDRIKLPQHTINITVRDQSPDFVNYGVGDSVAVIIREIEFQQLLRIKSRNFKILPSGQATIDITFQQSVSSGTIEDEEGD